MERLKEYFKLFSYIFYPGMVIILYFAQVIEGKLSSDLIFCPVDIVFVGILMLVYLLVSKLDIGFLRNRQGKVKLPFIILIGILLIGIMALYDDLKVYFYLNIEVSISLIVIVVVWLLLLLGCYLMGKSDEKNN